MATPAPKSDIGEDADAQIFVSYSRRDLPFARWLVAALEAKGFDAYLDMVDIAPGEAWKDRLAALILGSDTVVFVVTPNSVASDICAWELDESARLNKRILPIVAERITEASAPANLQSLNWIFATGDDDREEAIARLADALRTDLPWIREHTRIAGLAGRWQRQSRSKALTLRGSDLSDAEDWLARRPTELATPTDLHRDFIRGSRRAATVRQRWFGGVAALVVAVSLVLAGWAELNRRDARLQRDEATAQRVEAEKQRDRAERALQDVKLQRDRAEMAVNNVVGLGESLYMVTTDFSDLLRSPQVDKNSAAFKTIRRLVNLGDELAKVMHDQSIYDKSLYLSRARSLAYASNLFAEGGDTQLAIVTANRSLQLLEMNMAASSTQLDEVSLIADVLEDLGDIKWQTGDIQGARDDYLKSIRILEGAILHNSDVSRPLAFVLIRLGLFTTRTGSPQEGEHNIRRALDILCRREREADPHNMESAKSDVSFTVKFAADRLGMQMACR